MVQGAVEAASRSLPILARAIRAAVLVLALVVLIRLRRKRQPKTTEIAKDAPRITRALQRVVGGRGAARRAGWPGHDGTRVRPARLRGVPGRRRAARLARARARALPLRRRAVAYAKRLRPRGPRRGAGDGFAVRQGPWTVKSISVNRLTFPVTGPRLFPGGKGWESHAPGGFGRILDESGTADPATR